MPRLSYRLLTLLAGLAGATALPAQQFLLNAPIAASDHSAETTAVLATPKPAAKQAELGHGIDRYLDLNAFNYGIRYRSVFTDNGAHAFSQGQQKFLASGKFKFDEQGRYGIGFRISSGRYFNWAYADFIGGGEHQFITLAEAKMPKADVGVMESTPAPAGFFNSGGGQLYFREAFLSAQPIRGIEAQFGGIGLTRGVNTEATSYDDDGYITGERLAVRRPKQIFLTELSYTRGYLGDFYQPNFFVRGQRLAIANYWQILGQKDFGTRVALSTDYSFLDPAKLAGPFKTWREAILVDTRETKVLDSVRFEAYQRISQSGIVTPFRTFAIATGKGYTVTIARKAGHYAAFEGGFADIDNGYYGYTAPNSRSSVIGLTLNGDQYGRGRRGFVRTTIPITRSVSMVANFSHLLFSAPLGSGHVWNAQALTAGFVIDGKKLFFHPHTM